MITRKEVWGLESQFRELKDNVENPNWKRAYEQILGGLDYLDACIARSSESIPKEIPIDKQNPNLPELKPTE